ncbi:TDP-4-oxo-6-deoxy-alpha-D-glucose-3, 4-oxoisomerase [Cupriavidus taiwanensis]|uniref:sugar 3,4-ketoisomerase n=1 Tax=Cupriavidus taiwanensis TaxID=164546 RepID=UPI000E198655|nr:FdtA/QdtA family cupin domain-containing protein [Cupriavidus taiwanensis]SOY82780.1 TDP-4-oxo-6-deoxy-alpha-D-glucose-3, 4-oxoisomerase [Cupriavidus taiwanensis]SOY84535.1 TDP-4-oxo-6-deoxy-alpha-D-glucose-3, 4-oxoisomerase [Cupriavidus taiwanensis]
MSTEDCRIIQLPRISDARGSLSFVEGGQHIPFDIERIYYLYDIPGGAARGAHAHKALQQLIVPIAGSFEVVLDDGRSQRKFFLDRPDQGLYVCPMMWRELGNFSAGAVCMVLASRKYEESDYFREYDTFLKVAIGEK